MLRKQPSLHLYVADDINLVSDSGRLLLWPRTHDTFAPTISSLLPVLGRETIYCLTTMTQAMDSSNDNWKYFCLWVYWSRHFVTVGYFRTRFENSIGIEKEKMNSVGDVNGSICYAGMEVYSPNMQNTTTTTTTTTTNRLVVVVVVVFCMFGEYTCS